MLKLALVGPDLGEPYLFMRWLAERYSVGPVVDEAGAPYGSNGLVVLDFIEGDREVRATAVWPAANRDPRAGIEAILRDADGAMLVLTRVSTATVTNFEALTQIVPKLIELDLSPVIVANDSGCGDPDAPPLPAATISERLNMRPIHETTLGPTTGSLECDFGVAAAWSHLLGISFEQRRKTPYRG